ncbi:uncharacterized protein LOC113166677 [Anabas testudineus]|uniref:uncharacterized protein LOC113166677 n=1 Tax=Anabas testudineus TaxID=64144 RepID=UPI00143CE735|nr:uncharacterized protein LOC113166677 [Anabas testudineus]
MDRNDSLYPALRKSVSASSNVAASKPTALNLTEQQRCKDCAALSLRVERLEKTVAMILAEKASVLNSSPHPETPDPETKETKRARVRHSGKTGPHSLLTAVEGTVCGGVLDDFHKFRLGCRTSSADRETAQSQKSHVLSFMMFMLKHTKDQQAALQSLRFLYNMQQLKEFPNHLQDEGCAPASVRNMLNSASTFLTYVKRFRVLHSDLSDDKTSALLHHLKRLQVDMCRGVAVHLKGRNEPVNETNTDETKSEAGNTDNEENSVRKGRAAKRRLTVNTAQPKLKYVQREY